jgi:hypothetical protein
LDAAMHTPVARAVKISARRARSGHAGIVVPDSAQTLPTDVATPSPDLDMAEKDDPAETNAPNNFAVVSHAPSHSSSWPWRKLTSSKAVGFI